MSALTPQYSSQHALAPSLRAALAALSCAWLGWMSGCHVTPEALSPCAQENETSCSCSGAELGELRCDAQSGALSCVCPGNISLAERDLSMPDLGLDADMSPTSEPLLECEEIAGAMLPPEFETGDIGPVGLEGSTLAQGERVCMEASGKDIWGTSDEFRFTSRTWSGDFDMRVLVSELTGSQGYTKAGLMVRESRDADARFIMLQLTQFENPFIIGRANPGMSNASSTPNTAGNAPLWLRLVRRGPRFTSFVSRDGASWTLSGEMWLEAMPQDTHIGLALSNLNNMALAHATFDHFQVASPGSPCPAELDCEAIDAVMVQGYAGLGGLDLGKFRGNDVRTLTVSNGGDSVSTGTTLRARLLKAQQNATLGLYTIIEVDTAQVTEPIRIGSPLPEAQNTWIKGNGAVVRGQQDPLSADCLPPVSPMCQRPPSGFVLGSESILEGFVLERFDRAVQSSGETSGVLITHNTFSEGTGPFIELSDTNGKTRHFTISYNHFAPSGTPDGMRAVELQRRCEPESACPDDTSSLFVSLHYNRFGPSVAAGYPYGGAKLVYTNNLVEDLSSEGIDLRGSGEVWSRHNVFETSTTGPIAPFRYSGTPMFNSVGDNFGPGVAITGRREHQLTFSPTIPFSLHIDPEELAAWLAERAGPSPAP